MVLGIPENALEYSGVAEILNENLRTALIFELAHQLGHIYNAHNFYSEQLIKKQYTDNSYSDIVNNEIVADLFAIDILRRIGLPLQGIDVYFKILTTLTPNNYDFSKRSHYEYFISQNICHPITSGRIFSFTQELESEISYYTRFQDQDISRVDKIIRNLYDLASRLEDREELGLLKKYFLSVTISQLTPTAVPPPWLH
jgi:hypothetical protein